MVPLLSLTVLGAECIEPYDTPAEIASTNILVIDGSLNTEGISTIRLTRTQNPADNTPVKEELGATVAFEEENGPTYLLTPDGKGNYRLAEKTFNLSKKHRIAIQTSDDNEYISEFVPLIKSPKIDSINWEITADMGLQFYVNTHDPENNIQYYSWTYEETWRYVAAFYSRYEWVNRVPSLRQNNIYVCYNTKPSQNIFVSSVANLSESIIHNFPLLYLRQDSEKIRFKYSLLVRQTALTEEAFTYMVQLQKNTENLGTLFDPQPSQLTGNIQCTTDPTVHAIGYFLAGSTTERRIFVSSDFLPRVKYYDTYHGECTAESVILVSEIPMYSDITLQNILLLESQAIPGMGNVLGYLYTNAICADCRKGGGTTKVPDFWE